MTKTTEAKWRRLIAEQSRSGLTVREFAAAEGMAAATLYWWRSKLRGDNRGHTKLVPVEVVEHCADPDTPAIGCFELQVDGVMTRNRRVKHTWKVSRRTRSCSDATTRRDGCAAGAA